MFFRFLIAFFSFVSLSLAAHSYPKTYSKLGTPLFSAVQHFSDYKNIDDLNITIGIYETSAYSTLTQGFQADKTKEKSIKKAYLKELRKLQSLYDKVLHKLHESISRSIDEDNYVRFLHLTSYAFDGLLTNTNLRNKSIAFYLKHKTQDKCNVLEKKIADEKLCKETQEQFSAEIIHSSYNSKSKNISKKSVNISILRVSNTIIVSFYNKNIYDVTIRIKSHLKNIQLKKQVPTEFVIKANSAHEFAQLHLGEGKSQYSFSWTYTMGSKDAKHDDSYIYRLPFTKGSSFVVSQGYNGNDTHKGSSAYSIDFPMPIGTKIVAARDGVVVKTKSNSNRGGYDKKYASSGNYVRIMHSDGTFATYYHLKQHGVMVKVGDKIFQGQTIGYSGNTGYTSGPHLHFSVFKAVSANKIMTLPTKILTSQGVILEPLVGHYYKAK